jgi:rubrerythrin
MQLTQKENTLLKDLKNSEQLCIDKYTKHSESAHDPQLKNLFSSLASDERKHLDTLTKIEGGTIPSASGTDSTMPTFTATYTGTANTDAKDDAYLCTDLLSGEKQVSHLYDTCIFEFKDERCRQALNHIQSEEQQHGKMIYDYMQANSMY